MRLAPALLTLGLLLPACPRGSRPLPEPDAPPAVAQAVPASLSSPTLGALVRVPPGTFTMGARAEGYAGPLGSERAHPVTITRGFWLMEHEVTEGAWLAILGSLPEGAQPSDPALPVSGMSWDELQIFLDRLEEREGVRYRLPTEAEWELAARAGGSTLYAGSDDPDAVAWHLRNSEGRKRPVCQLQRNALGLCDLSGNVLEWTSDWYGPHAPTPAIDPTGPVSGSYRVHRGGAWSLSSFNALIFYRSPVYIPPTGHRALGFRLARSEP